MPPALEPIKKRSERRDRGGVGAVELNENRPIALPKDRGEALAPDFLCPTSHQIPLHECPLQSHVGIKAGPVSCQVMLCKNHGLPGRDFAPLRESWRAAVRAAAVRKEERAKLVPEDTFRGPRHQSCSITIFYNDAIPGLPDPAGS